MHTVRGMLEREGNNILDTLDRDGERVSKETFTDDNLDATQIIGRTPVILLKQLATERWKS